MITLELSIKTVLEMLIPELKHWLVRHDDDVRVRAAAIPESKLLVPFSLMSY